MNADKMIGARRARQEVLSCSIGGSILLCVSVPLRFNLL